MASSDADSKAYESLSQAVTVIRKQRLKQQLLPLEIMAFMTRNRAQGRPPMRGGPRLGGVDDATYNGKRLSVPKVNTQALRDAEERVQVAALYHGYPVQRALAEPESFERHIVDIVLARQRSSALDPLLPKGKRRRLLLEAGPGGVGGAFTEAPNLATRKQLLKSAPQAVQDEAAYLFSDGVLHAPTMGLEETLGLNTLSGPMRTLLEAFLHLPL